MSATLVQNCEPRSCNWGSRLRMKCGDPVLLQLGGDSPRAPSQPPAPGNWRLAGLRVERDAPQSPGPWHPAHLRQVPARRARPGAGRNHPAGVRAPPKARSRAVGAPPESAPSSRPSVPGKAPASQLRQGAHQNTRREQRFASCSGLGFPSGNTCNILLAEGAGAGRGRPCNRCRCSCRARQRCWRPGRLAGLLGVN